MRLPSIWGAPLPSPEAAAAGAEHGAGAADAGRMSRSVSDTRGMDGARPGGARQSGRLAALLLPATDEPLDPEIVALGADARYWRSVAKLALELVARERFVPTLECGAGPSALAPGPDRPARCEPLRAVGPGDAAGLPIARRRRPSSAATVLSRALGAAVDALVVDGLQVRRPDQ